MDQWAGRSRGETNFMVRSLVGKSMKDELTADDLDAAKELVSAKFVVGLMARFEESVHRFNLLLGVDEGDPVNQKCIADFSTSQGDAHEDRNADAIVEKNNWNSYSHPKAEKGSDAWQSLAKIHSLDMQLYRHVVQQFAAQRKLFQPLPEATE